MNKMSREEKVGEIFKTGRAMRFYMDRHVLANEMPLDAVCSELTTVQIKAAIHVWQTQPLSLGDLARGLSISPPAASALVEKLVEKEVLIREADPGDRRRVLIRVHPRAEASMNTINQQFLEAFHSVADRLDDGLIDKWFKVCSRITDILQEKDSV